MRLEINTRMLDKVIIVDCDGALVYGEEATYLRQRVKEALLQCPNLVLDLADVTFIDSNGVGTMVGLVSAAQAAGGGLKVAALGPKAKDVLQITKLTALFGAYETVEQAAASFAQAA